MTKRSDKDCHWDCVDVSLWGHQWSCPPALPASTSHLKEAHFLLLKRHFFHLQEKPSIRSMSSYTQLSKQQFQFAGAKGTSVKFEKDPVDNTVVCHATWQDFFVVLLDKTFFMNPTCYKGTSTIIWLSCSFRLSKLTGIINCCTCCFVDCWLLDASSCLCTGWRCSWHIDGRHSWHPSFGGLADLARTNLKWSSIIRGRFETERGMVFLVVEPKPPFLRTTKTSVITGIGPPKPASAMQWLPCTIWGRQWAD